MLFLCCFYRKFVEFFFFFLKFKKNKFLEFFFLIIKIFSYHNMLFDVFYWYTKFDYNICYGLKVCHISFFWKIFKKFKKCLKLLYKYGRKLWPHVLFFLLLKFLTVSESVSNHIFKGLTNVFHCCWNKFC